MEDFGDLASVLLDEHGLGLGLVDSKIIRMQLVLNGFHHSVDSQLKKVSVTSE